MGEFFFLLFFGGAPFHLFLGWRRVISHLPDPIVVWNEPCRVFFNLFPDFWYNAPIVFSIRHMIKLFPLKKGGTHSWGLFFFCSGLFFIVWPFFKLFFFFPVWVINKLRWLCCFLGFRLFFFFFLAWLWWFFRLLFIIIAWVICFNKFRWLWCFFRLGSF